MPGHRDWSRTREMFPPKAAFESRMGLPAVAKQAETA
jgi:hypothetical protein